MAPYMLLLYDDPSSWAKLSPEDMQKAIEKYIAWGRKLEAEGRMLAGHKLTDEPGKTIRGRGSAMRITDGPFAETKEVLGGYYLVSADGYTQAVELCRDHPHLEYGGTIEVREVDPMSAARDQARASA